MGKHKEIDVIDFSGKSAPRASRGQSHEIEIPSFADNTPSHSRAGRNGSYGSRQYHSGQKQPVRRTKDGRKSNIQANFVIPMYADEEEFEEESRQAYREESHRTYREELPEKKHFRWDIVFALLVMGAIGLCGYIVYSDLHANDFDPTQAVAESYGEGIRGTEAAAANANTAQKNYSGNQKIICLDPAHGGSDHGNAYKDVFEKDQTLEMVKLVKKELETAGYQVVLTRSDDSAVTLEQRIQTAERAKAGILISVHRDFNATDGTVSGISGWSHPSTDKKASVLATTVLMEINKLQKTSNLGVKTGTTESAYDNYIVNQAKCTSFVLKLGYITSVSDDALVVTDKEEVAKSISKGIINYIKSV